MNVALKALLAAHHGVVRRADVPADLAGAREWALARREMARIFPHTFVAADADRDDDIRRRAALAYVSGPAALSHVSALQFWGLPVPPEQPIHLTVSADRRLRSAKGLTVHREVRFSPTPPHVLTRRGLPVVRAERALVQSWPILDGDVARGPVIVAVQEGLTTPRRLWEEALACPNGRGRAQLLGLLGHLRAGCRSQLEIWGYLKVFRHPELPESQGQVPVELATGRVYLDRYFPRERVNVELDGAAWHRSDEQRERDLRRDAALSRLGILVVRFTHHRLVTEPEEVRRELLAILAARREQLRSR